jgi:hypothetical protein
MNRIKTFFIVEPTFGASYPDQLDTIVNRWVEEQQVTVVDVSICHRGGSFVVVLLYRGPGVAA